MQVFIRSSITKMISFQQDPGLYEINAGTSPSLRLHAVLDSVHVHVRGAFCL